MIIHIHYTYVPSYLSIYQPCMSMVENVWDWMVGEHARPLNQYRTSFFSSSFSSHGNPLNLVSASKPPRVSILKRPGKLNTKFKPKCFPTSPAGYYIPPPPPLLKSKCCNNPTKPKYSPNNVFCL